MIFRLTGSSSSASLSASDGRCCQPAGACRGCSLLRCCPPPLCRRSRHATRSHCSRPRHTLSRGHGTHGRALAGIVLSATALAFYKYGQFLAADVVGLLNAPLAARLQDVIERLQPATPPLAISFFTFEFVHYLIEVRRGGAPIRNPLEFGLFAIFLPSLVAGPIKRYQQFVPALRAARRRWPSSTTSPPASSRVIVGYCQEAVVADNLTDVPRGSRENLRELPVLACGGSFSARWRCASCSTSAATATSRSAAPRMFGIRLPENFNWPYVATQPARVLAALAHLAQHLDPRLHLHSAGRQSAWVLPSQSSTPSSPSRCAACGTVPAWHFVAWGVYHGLGLAVSNYYATLGPLGRGVAIAVRRTPLLGWLVTTTVRVVRMAALLLSGFAGAAHGVAATDTMSEPAAPRAPGGAVDRTRPRVLQRHARWLGG